METKLFHFDVGENGFLERRLVFKTEKEDDDLTKVETEESEMPSATRLNKVEDEFLAATGLNLGKDVNLDSLQLEDKTRMQIRKTFGNDLEDVLKKSKDRVLREAIAHKIKTEKAGQTGFEKFKDATGINAVKRKVSGEKFSELKSDLQLEKDLKDLDFDYSDEEYEKVVGEHERSFKKLLIYSPKYLKSQFGEKLDKKGVKTDLLKLLDFSELIDGWEEDPASRVLLANLLSAGNRGYLNQIDKNDKIELDSELEEERKTAHENLAKARDDRDAVARKKEKIEKKLEAEKKAKKLLKTLGKLNREKENIDANIPEADKMLKAAKTNLEKKGWFGKNKSPSVEAQTFYRDEREKLQKLQESLIAKKDEIGDDEEQVVDLAKLIDDKIPNFAAAENLFKNKTFDRQDFHAELRKTEDDLAEEETNLAMKETEYKSINQKYSENLAKVSKSKIAGVEKAADKTKMTPQEVLIEIKTKAFEKSLGDDEITKKVHEKAKSMAKAAVGNEISEVKNNVHAEKLEEQAAEAMKKRGFGGALAGKALSKIKSGFDYVDKNKEGARRSIGLAKGVGSIARRVLVDLGMGYQMKKTLDIK